MALPRFACPECGARSRVTESWAPGEKIKCGECGLKFSPSAAVKKRAADEEESDRLDAGEERSPRDQRRTPAKSKSRAASGTGFVIAGIVLFTLLVAGGGIAALAYFVLDFPKPAAQAPAQVVQDPQFFPPAADRAPPPPEQKPDRPLGNGAEKPPANKAPEEKGDAKQPPVELPPPPAVPRSLGLARLNVGRINVGEMPARAAAEFDAVNYIPGDQSAVLGIDLQTLAGKLVTTWLTERMAAMHEQGLLDIIQQDTGLTLQELDHVVAAGKLDLSEENWKGRRPFPFQLNTYVVKTKIPYDRAKTLQLTKASQAKRLQGKEYFALPTDRTGKVAFLVFPAERIMLVTTVAEGQLGPILTMDGKPRLSAESLSTLGTLDKAHAWAILSPEIGKQEPFAGLFATAGMQSFTAQLTSAKALGFSLRLQGPQMKIGMVANGGDEPGAGRLTATAQEYWNKQGKNALEAGRMTFPLGWQGIAGDVATTVQLQNQGKHCRGTAAITFKSLDQLLKTLE